MTVYDLILQMKNKVQTLTHHDSVYMCSGIINTWDSLRVEITSSVS